MEQVISLITFRRNNYLFCGNNKRAKNNTVFYTFITCCRKINIEPYKWMKGVLLKPLSNMVENATFKPSNNKSPYVRTSNIRAFY